MDTQNIWTKNPEVLVTELPDMVVLLDEDGEMYQLRGVARVIWLALPSSATQLIEQVTATFEVDQQTASADIAAFLSQMTQRGLLTNSI